MTDTSLLAEVQRDLLDDRPLAGLLRKCILVGTQANSTALRLWATKELKGYENLEEVPAYRLVAAPIQMDAVTGSAWIKGQTISPSQFPEFARGKITNEVPLFAGVSEIESLHESARSAGKGPHLSLPGWEYVANAIDEASGNPFQHINAMYWALSVSSLASVLDDIRTALTELLAELELTMPDNQSNPTAEQADQAVSVAVSGGSAHFNIAASNTTVTTSGQASPGAITIGPTGSAGHDLTQTVSYTAGLYDAVRDWLAEYREALPELDGGIRQIAEQQLGQVQAEVDRSEPQEVVVATLMGSLKSFAQNAVSAAGTSAGTLALAEVLAHWPFH